MTTPSNVFKTTIKSAKAGNFQFLSQRVAYWQQLSKVVQPLLPQPEQWQIVCFEDGILTVTGCNQAMISQLNYLQAHYVSKLQHINALENLNKIRANLRYDLSQKPKQAVNESRMSPETKQMLAEMAEMVQDAKLSQALKALASVKK